MKRVCERLTDAEWESLRTILPPQKPKTGRPANDHRLVVDAILWQRATGIPWRQLPEHFGAWQTVYSRLRRWQEAGVWSRVEAKLASNGSSVTDQFTLVETVTPSTPRRSLAPTRSNTNNNGTLTRWSSW
jgi:transposase